MRVGVSGAAGRMGAMVCQTVALEPDLELVAAVDPGAAGAVIEGLTIAGEPRAFADAGAEVVVDFTVAQAARRTVPWLAMHGMHAVVGTTGLTDDDLPCSPRSSARAARTASSPPTSRSPPC